MQNDVATPPKLSGRLIMDAIRRLGGSRGSTVVEIKKYLRKEKKLECDAGSIKLYLKNAVERGKVSLLNGKYKINESANRKRRISGGSAKRLRRRSNGPSKSPGSMKTKRGSSCRQRPNKVAPKVAKLSGSRRRRLPEETVAEIVKLSVLRSLTRPKKTAAKDAKLSGSRSLTRPKKAAAKDAKLSGSKGCLSATKGISEEKDIFWRMMFS